MNLPALAQNHALFTPLIAAAALVLMLSASAKATLNSDSQSSGQSAFMNSASRPTLLAAAISPPARRDWRGDDGHDDIDFGAGRWFPENRGGGGEGWLELLSSDRFGPLATLLSVLGAGLGVVWRGFRIVREWRRPGSTN